MDVLRKMIYIWRIPVVPMKMSIKKASLVGGLGYHDHGDIMGI
jgi:hypothetical protein